MTTQISGTTGVSQVQDGTITSAKIVDGTITSAKIVDGTIAAVDVATELRPIKTGQTWQDVTASRAFNTDYTNSTGRPIYLAVWANSGSQFVLYLYIDGNKVMLSCGSTVAYEASVGGFIPAGSVYKVANLSGGTLVSWKELR